MEVHALECSKLNAKGMPWKNQAISIALIANVREYHYRRPFLSNFCPTSEAIRKMFSHSGTVPESPLLPFEVLKRGAAVMGRIVKDGTETAESTQQPFR
jgi:hypothetical protein